MDTATPGYAAIVTIDQIVVVIDNYPFVLDCAEEPALFEKCERMIKNGKSSEALKAFFLGT